jgi:cyclic pyranopterin phosphate synthase
VTAGGALRMVDVSAKPKTAREATAAGFITVDAAARRVLERGATAKGHALEAARLAGIMAAKRTSSLIPLCHPLPISAVALDIDPDDTLPGLRVRATVKVAGKTGVEMEALTAVSIACLTIYDMAKAIDRGMEIGAIRLAEKRGGKSGRWKRKT